MRESGEIYTEKGDTLITQPMKGTARRSADAIEDEEIKNTLRNNLKERTENVMAVDVARNDLSQVAQKGTVEVTDLFGVALQSVRGWTVMDGDGIDGNCRPRDGRYRSPARGTGGGASFGVLYPRAHARPSAVLLMREALCREGQPDQGVFRRRGGLPSRTFLRSGLRLHCAR